MLDEAADTPAQAAVEKLLYDPDIYVRTQALLYVAHHTQIDPLDRIEELGNFQDFSIRAAMITFLAQPGRHENLDAARLLLERMLEDEVPATRLEAARLLEILPDRFEDQLGVVLDSKDPEQVRLAIRAVGHLRKRKFVAKVISRLGDPELTRDATEAVAAFGDRVSGRCGTISRTPTHRSTCAARFPTSCSRSARRRPSPRWPRACSTPIRRCASA